MKTIIAFIKDEAGVSAIEYALLASFIAMTIVAGVTFLGMQLSTGFNSVASIFKVG